MIIMHYFKFSKISIREAIMDVQSVDIDIKLIQNRILEV